MRRFLRRPTRRLARLAVIALLPVLGLTAAAPAQFGEAAGFGEMMSPYFLRRDLDTIARGLDLDDGQAVIVESLFWDYEDEHEAGKVRLLERLSIMREEIKQKGREEVLQLVFKPFEDRSREWADSREQFLENVKAILTTDQLADWTSFRRELRREKELPKGRFSGESVNVFQVIRDMELDPPVREVVNPILEEYAYALDDALLVRERLFQESRLTMMNSIRDEDPSTALAIHENQISSRVTVRDVNDLYVETITGALSGAEGAEFQQQALLRGYPRVYRPTAAERIFAAARNLEDVAPDTMEAIEALEVAFGTELDVVNATLIRLLREYEPEEALYRAKSFAMRSSGKTLEKPVDPARAEFRERDQLGSRYVSMLKDLLTPEQFRGLPGASRFLRRADNRGGGVGKEQTGRPPRAVDRNKQKRARAAEERRKSLGGR